MARDRSVCERLRTELRLRGFLGGCGGGWGEGWNSGLGGSKGSWLYSIEPGGVVGTGSTTRRNVYADGRVVAYFVAREIDA